MGEMIFLFSAEGLCFRADVRGAETEVLRQLAAGAGVTEFIVF